jgi:hypothetical protein
METPTRIFMGILKVETNEFWFLNKPLKVKARFKALVFSF